MGKLFFKLPRELPSAINVNNVTSNTMSTRHGHGGGRPDSPYEPFRPNKTNKLDLDILRYMMDDIKATEQDLDNLSIFTFSQLKKEAIWRKEHM